MPANVLAGKEDGPLPQHKAAVHSAGGAVQRQTGAHGGGKRVQPFRLQLQLRHRAQRRQLHRTAQRDIIRTAAGHRLRRCTAGRQPMVQVDVHFQSLGTDHGLLYLLCRSDPAFGQQPPQRQLRQQLRRAHHPKGRLFIDIKRGSMLCRKHRCGAIRQTRRFKGSSPAKKVVDLHKSISFPVCRVSEASRPRTYII